MTRPRFDTKVVAVDFITLINPQLRIRKILTYRRPDANDPLKEVGLVVCQG